MNWLEITLCFVKILGTDEEHKDLIEAYNSFKGDMDKIMASVPGSSADDELRFCEILKGAIKSKEIRSYKKFTETSSSSSINRRKKEAEREAKEAEEMAKKFGLDKKLLGSNGEEELKQIIIKRGEKRMSALESLVEKYGGNKNKKVKTTGKGKKGKKKIEESEVMKEPTEEEFQAIQEKLKNRGKKR
jgi:DnaJ family protein C protein 9